MGFERQPIPRHFTVSKMALMLASQCASINLQVFSQAGILPPRAACRRVGASAMQESDLPEPNQLQMLIPIHGTSQASVSIAVCTGGSCEQRCSPGVYPKKLFETLTAESSIDVVEVNCMNQCKRGPVVRLVAEGQLQTVPERMNAVEQKRKTFQRVGGAARVEGIWGIASAIADGSTSDAHGDFTCTPHGPLPPSAM